MEIPSASLVLYLHDPPYSLSPQCLSLTQLCKSVYVNRSTWVTGSAEKLMAMARKCFYIIFHLQNALVFPPSNFSESFELVPGMLRMGDWTSQRMDPTCGTSLCEQTQPCLITFCNHILDYIQLNSI